MENGVELAGRYRVIRPLGGGAYGKVSLVETIGQPGVLYALKEIIEIDLPGDEREDALRLFRREAEILTTLDHPGLPRFVDHFSIDRCHYLVMDYIGGATLEEKLAGRGTPFTAGEVLTWALELAGILEYLHALSPEPLVFRDLKPSNIMVDEKGRVRLIDFGIARYFNPGKIKDTYAMGTPGFSPPEQYGHGQSDARADLFSFGATLYYLLSGADMARFNFRFPPLRDNAPTVPPWLERVIMRCLSLNPGDRYQTTAELVADLKSLGTKDATMHSPLPGSGHAPPAGNLPSAPGIGGKNFYRDVGLILVAVVVVILLCWKTPFGLSLLIYSILALVAFLPFYCIWLVIRKKMSILELFIILSIYVILGWILVPNYQRSRSSGILSSCLSNLKNLGYALDLCYEAEKHYPATLSGIVPRYLKQLPSCPGGRRNAPYGYIHTQDHERYTVYCKGRIHLPVLRQEDYPRYDSVDGLVY